MRRSATAVSCSLLVLAFSFGGAAASSNVAPPTGPTILPGVVQTQIPESGPDVGAPPPRAG